MIIAPILFLIAVVIFVIEVVACLRQIGVGMNNRPDNLRARLWHTLKSVLGQQRIRERWWGFAHFIIFYAFLIFLFSGIEQLIQASFSAWHLFDWIGVDASSGLHLVETYFVWLTLGAVGVVSIRRLCQKNEVRNTPEAWVILVLIACIMLSHIGVIAGNFAQNAEAGWLTRFLPLTSRVGNQIPQGYAQVIHNISSLIHILCISIFLVLIPRGKHLHILFALPNLFFQYRTYDRAGKPVTGPQTPDMSAYEAELEAAIEKELPEDEWPTPGIGKISDFSSVMRLNAYSCTQCQRCTNACPMVSGGIGKGPMETMLKLREMLKQKKLATPAIPALCEEAEVWSCTQCGACDRVCPVGNHHVDRMISLRRHAIVHDTGPEKLGNLFANIERSGNPWGYSKADRSRWSEKIQNAEPIEGRRVLIFAGCMSAYDAKARKTLENAVAWLNAQGFHVSHIMRETCCGEPLRRVGNESAYQQCMKTNLDQIKSIEHDVILTLCPHCAQTLSDDYFDGENRLKVAHFLQFVAEFHACGELEIDETEDDRYEEDEALVEKRRPVFHVPCRLSKQPESPEKMLAFSRALGLRFADKDFSSSHCCGGGGGQFFMENGREISQMRASEILQKGPVTVASACPFCMQILGDEFLRNSTEESEANSLIQMVNVVDIIAERVRFRSRESK